MRISRGKAGDEVSLQLDSGFQLVGFAVTGSGLKVRSAIHAFVDEWTIVIALPE